ncbi:MAG: hypothetical protein AMJ90_09550 [candidate division Zixibacteria bacterium SM23_73_2]|nr:MAG: hypothetical protein AMJ90_09550 [candidate division Zixibacteria bacterium SM23_73_2]
MSLLEIFLFAGTLVIMLVGLAGVILPVLPGIPLIFGGALLYGALTGFKKITVDLILIFAGLTAFGLMIDYLANYLGVKKMGGGRAGAIGAVFGLIIGIFAGIVWIIILPFLFAVLFELLTGKNNMQALKAGIGTFLGLLFGGSTKFILGCIMIGIFAWRILF